MKLNGKQKIKKISLGFESPEKKQSKIWRELNRHHAEFQHILRLLVNHEGHALGSETNWLFHMRKALYTCDSRQLRLFLCNLGGYLFHVVAQAEGPGGHLVTSWLHEDGIQAERDLHLHNKTHPVHYLSCMTDFYHEDSQDFDLESCEKMPSEAALSMMEEE